MSGRGRPAEHLAVVQLLGRERDGHGQDDALDAVAPRGPRRTSRRAWRRSSASRRDEAPEELRRLLPDHVEVGEVGLEVADQEVVDVVLARVDAGGEARPGRGRLGGLGRAQHRERALVRERLQVRQLALVHPLPREGRVHPVEADHEDPLLGAAQRLPPGRPSAVEQESVGGRGRSRGAKTATRRRRADETHQGTCLSQRDGSR